jgi:hypothetical protein
MILVIHHCTAWVIFSCFELVCSGSGGLFLKQNKCETLFFESDWSVLSLKESNNFNKQIGILSAI